MADLHMGLLESRFAEIVWEEEPVTTSKLVKLAEETFGWKRTTTHTVIKRLCQKGLFENRSGIVTSLLSKDEYYAIQSTSFVNETFGGSLPSFVASFIRGKGLDPEEAASLKKMIEDLENKT